MDLGMIKTDYIQNGDDLNVCYDLGNVTDNGDILPRGFCALVLQPIYDLFGSIQVDNRDLLCSMIDKLPSVSVTKTEMEAGGKTLLKAVMRSWLPVANEILKMVCGHALCTY